MFHDAEVVESVEPAPEVRQAENVHDHAFGLCTMTGQVLGDGIGRDVHSRHLCVAYDVRIDLATAATRVNEFRVRGESFSYEVIESGLYQVVSIETGDGGIGGSFDGPPFAVPVLIPHVAHGCGIGAFLFRLSPGSMAGHCQPPGEPKKTQQPAHHVGYLHLGMAVGTRRQFDRQFADFESSHMQECQALKEKLVIAALDPVKQSGGYGIQTIKAKSSGRIVWQPQQRPSQKMPQMGHKSSKQIPFPQTAFPLEPRSHHDVAGAVRRIVIDDEDVRRQAELEQLPNERPDILSLIVGRSKKQEFVALHFLCNVGASHRIVNGRISDAAMMAAANIAINANATFKTLNHSDSNAGISQFQRAPIVATA